MDNRAKIASAISLAWVIGGIVVVGMNWGKFNELRLNEVGDFLAGAFSPLAFLWLIVGYFQQGDELKQNTEALKLQADELKHAVAEYEKLNDTNSRHLQILEDEKIKREEREADAVRMHLSRFPGKFRYSTDNKYEGFHFLLKNVGNDVTNLQMSFFLSNATLSKGQITELPKNSFIEIMVETKDKTPREGKLWISYINGIGKNERKSYEIFVLHDGRMVLSEPGKESENMRDMLAEMEEFLIKQKNH